MRELKVIVTGNSSGYQKAVQEAVAITKNAAKQMGEAEAAAMYKETNQYVQLWTSAVKERERLESLSRKRRLTAEEAGQLELSRFNEKIQSERLVKTAAAQKAAYAAMAAGSMPAGMTGAAAAQAAERTAMQKAMGTAEAAGLTILGVKSGGYILNKAGNVVGKFKGADELEKAVETATKGMNELGHAGHGSSRMAYEFQVLLHEAAARNYRRMMGSGMILARLASNNILKYSGISFVADVISKIPGVSALTKIPGLSKILPGIGTILDVFTVGKTVREGFRLHSALTTESESKKSLKETTGDVAGEMRSRVEGLRRLGKISDKDAAGYMRQLKGGTFEGVSGVLNATAPLMKDGTIAEQEKTIQYQERLAKAKEHLQEVEFAGMDNQNKLLQLLRQESDLRDRIATAKKNGDAATAIELQAELLGKQGQEKATREDLQNDWNKKNKKATTPFEHPSDNLSKMGLFTQSGLLFNPQLDISKQQLEKLTSMERNISSIASRPDIWN